MEWTMRRIAVLMGWTGCIGAVIFCALTIYPLDYEPVDSAVLIGALFIMTVLHIVLNDTTFGSNG